MTMDAMNTTALREVEDVILAFENSCGMSSDEMLLCERNDSRLQDIDGFELMDWHYAVEQRKALSKFTGGIHAVGTPGRKKAMFSYARSSQQELANSKEPELDLVA